MVRRLGFFFPLPTAVEKHHLSLVFLIGPVVLGFGVRDGKEAGSRSAAQLISTFLPSYTLCVGR